MSQRTLQPRTLVLVIMVLAVATVRVIQSSNVFGLLSNFTPVGAMALFAGCYFKDRVKGFIVPLAALWLSDLFVNRIYYYDHWTFSYDGALWVYATFALVVVIGQLIRKVTFNNVIIASVAAALVHFIVTDFAVWIGGGTDITTGLPFTRDWSGLMECYALALPFLRNMLIGNLVFSGILFGGFEWMQRRYPSLRPQQA